MNFYCTTEHCSCMGIKRFFAGKAIRCTAESCKNKSEPSCGSCKWYAEPEGVCVNDQSEHVADFVWDERGCKEWEKRENGQYHRRDDSGFSIFHGRNDCMRNGVSC